MSEISRRTIRRARRDLDRLTKHYDSSSSKRLVLAAAGVVAGLFASAGLVATAAPVVENVRLSQAALQTEAAEMPVYLVGNTAETTNKPNLDALVNFKLKVDETERVITAHGKTWGEALYNAGVILTPQDGVNINLGDAPVGGTEVVISRNSVKMVTETKDIPFEVVKKYDSSLAASAEKVDVKGKNGSAITTYRVTVKDGKEVAREVVTKVVLPAVNQVVKVGAAQANPADLVAAGAQLVPSNPSASQAYARSLLQARGLGDGEFGCLVKLWNRESGWNPMAHNSSSGAHGIPQSLPGSKMASEGADWYSNPQTQIRWGLKYIYGRYGSPCAALGHSNSHGWY